MYWSYTVTLNGPHERAEAWREAFAQLSGLGFNVEVLSFGTDEFENSIRSGMKQW